MSPVAFLDLDAMDLITVPFDSAGRSDGVARMPSALLDADRHWWLHVDLDVLSPAALFAVDYPQVGGLARAQLEDLTEGLLSLGGCGGLSVAIYNPDLDGGAAAGRISDYVAGAARALARFAE